MVFSVSGEPSMGEAEVVKPVSSPAPLISHVSKVSPKDAALPVTLQLPSPVPSLVLFRPLLEATQVPQPPSAAPPGAASGTRRHGWESSPPPWGRRLEQGTSASTEAATGGARRALYGLLREGTRWPLAELGTWAAAGPEGTVERVAWLTTASSVPLARGLSHELGTPAEGSLVGGFPGRGAPPRWPCIVRCPFSHVSSATP